MTGSSPPNAPSCRLAARPESAGAARRFVTSALTGVGGDVLDTVELLTSELVTNAVLHAGTDIEVQVWAMAGRVHVSVFDEAPTRSIARREDDVDAATGRGLQMVESLASAFGSDIVSGTKMVWFELWPGVTDRVQSSWLNESAPQGRAVEVRLVGVPVGLCRAAKRHRRALLREGVLALMRGDADLGVSSQDLSDARAVSDLIDAAMDRRLADTSADQVVVDCALSLPAECARATGALATVLEALDGAARAGSLLTRPALPEIRQFRTWLIGQILDQVDGGRPAAWSRPVHLVAGLGHSGSTAEWHGGFADSAAVIAADDDNRIIAMSPAAGRLLGWEPEELRGQRLIAVIPEEWRDRHVAGFTEFLLTGRGRIVGRQVLLPALHRDGSIVEVNVTITVAQSIEGRTVFQATLTPATAPPEGLAAP